MAQYTSSQSGNWSDPATWGGAGVPGNGDTAIIAANTTVTVDVDVTVGASNGNYAAGSIEAAIRRLGSIGATSGGRLVVAAGKTLRLRGDLIDSWTLASVSEGYQLLTLEEGAQLIFDASTTSPTSTIYVAGPDGNTRPNCRYHFLGTAANPCIVTSDPGGANGRFSLRGFAIAMGGLYARFTKFSRIGDAANSAFAFYPNSTHVGVVFDVEDCEFDGCGKWETIIAMPSGANVYRVLRSHWRNTLSAECLVPRCSTAKTTGERLIEGCTFDKLLGQVSSAPQWTDFVIRNCVLYGSMAYNPDATGVWNVIERCILRKTTASVWSFNGNGSRLYAANDHDVTNPHYIGSTIHTSPTIDGVICDGGKNSESGDLWLSPTSNPSVARVYTARNILGIPNPSGGSCGIITIFGTATSNVSYRLERLTVFGKGSGWCVSVGETGTLPAGLIEYLRSSLFWATADASPLPLKTVDNRNATADNNPIEDLIAPDNANYNAGFNTRAVYPRSWFTNEGRGYAQKWSVTPGANDVDGQDPQFVDTTRNAAVADTRLFGQAVAPAWASGQAYAVGDVRSHSVSTFYGGAVINYRCVAAHTSDATTEPGSGSSWRSNWVYQSWWTIMDGMKNGDLTLIDKLYDWVRAGFAPRNKALKGKAHDGGDIGAVPVFVAKRGWRAAARGWWWRKF